MYCRHAVIVPVRVVRLNPPCRVPERVVRLNPPRRVPDVPANRRLHAAVLLARVAPVGESLQRRANQRYGGLTGTTMVMLTL